MWSASSHDPFKDHAELLAELCGPRQRPTEDSYWQELLSFAVPLTKSSPVDLEAAAIPYCEKLVRSNSETHNFQTLLEHFLLKLQDVDTSAKAQSATDATVFVRILLKHLIETLNADDLVAFLDEPHRKAKIQDSIPEEAPGPASWVDRLSNATVQLLTQKPLRDETYLMHLEVINLLLVMLSTQLYSPSATAEPGGHPFTEVLMDAQDSAIRMLLVLLQHFSERRSLPANAPVYRPPIPQQGGVLRLVKSAAASVFWLPIQAFTFLVRSGNERLVECPLCETATLLLLALLHHAPASDHQNPYQQALQQLQDRGDMSCDDQEVGSSGRSNTLSFLDLYKSSGRGMNSQRTVLLFYDLIHSSRNFRDFVVKQKNIDVVLLPMLRTLYSTSEEPPSETYMLLIVILMLSQNPSFSRNIHGITLQNLPWYSDRQLKNTTLGSLLIVMLLRTAHYNLSKLKDVYLHTNTLAALANLAPNISNLSSHAAQRIISLLEMLCRRYLRLSEKSRDREAGNPVHQELQVYRDFLRIVLEILNCMIANSLQHNPELVYSLLHKQDAFSQLQEIREFDDLLENVQLVIGFFNHRIDHEKGDSRPEWSVAQVLQVIRKNLEGWPGSNSLRHVPELRFSYEEESSPEGFFVPYIWTLIFSNTTIPWKAAAVALFSPFNEETMPTLDDVGSSPHFQGKDGNLTDASNRV